MHKILPAFSLLFLAVFTGLSADVQSNTPRFSNHPMIEEIQGILLIPNQDYLNYTSTKGLRGLQIHDVPIPGDVEYLRALLESLFMYQPLTQDLIKILKQQIILFYRSNNRPVVFVYVPPQEITDGVLQMVVMEGYVGQIAASGNCWFPSWFFEGSLSIGPGDPICTGELWADIAWLNRNPFRNVDVVLAPGCDVGTTNIELVVSDRCPLRVYVGADNTGIRCTEVPRLFTGITWGNVFWLDHILDYQYTTSQDFHKFQSHTLHYTVPLFWQHLILLYGGYSKVEPKIRDFKTKGREYQASVRYVVPFGCFDHGVLQEWSMGFDFKGFHDSVFFSKDLQKIHDRVNVSQFMTSYAYGFETDWNSFSFNLDLYGSPGKLLPHQSNEKFSELTPGAKVKYIYGKLTIGNVWFLPWGYSFWGQFRFQLSNQPLLPSERFGIGGYDTVRGYLERIYNADNAVVLNGEIRTPSVSVVRFFGGCGTDDGLWALVFCDYGVGNIYHKFKHPEFEDLEGEHSKHFEQFLSVGPGLRYTLNRYLSARIDWGVKLISSGKFHDGARSRWHGGLVFSY